MQIAELLLRKGSSVATLRPDATVRTVVSELAAQNIGALVVSTDGSSVDGIVSSATSSAASTASARRSSTSR